MEGASPGAVFLEAEARTVLRILGNPLDVWGTTAVVVGRISL